MKSRIKRFGLVIGVGLLASSSLYAFKGDAGTSNDPLVTKSYVDEQIAKVKNEQTGNTSIEEQVKAQAQLIDILKQQIDDLRVEVTEGSKSNGTYEVVSVPKGKYLLGKQGSEFIIRSGDGRVVGSTGGGLQNMTEGVDISDQAMVPKYHLLIIPREDGRGVYAATDLIVMVRGGYTIKE